MNEKIKQLAEEAGFTEGWFSESGDDCEREIKMFADLIVRECIGICNDTKDVSYLNGVIAGRKIKEHFGVK